MGGHYFSFAQIDQLVQEVQELEQGAETIGSSAINIARICAAVLVTILGLAFLFLKQQEDTAKKIGNIIMGLVIFYGLLETANGLL